MTTMADNNTSTDSINGRFVLRVLVKAALLFIVFNLIFALLRPVPALSRLSLYNSVVPGRERLPFGESPQSYNLSLYQLDAMFASHVINQPKAEDEYRVVLIGDSSVWGTLLRPEETLAGALNSQGLHTSDGRQVVVYNLGYPTITVTKDLLMLSRALDYEPDMIIWLTTLEALPDDKQLESPILQNNADEVRALIDDFDLDHDPTDPALVDPTFIDQTIVGQRRPLADLLRLNLYGIMWAATGIDQYYPDSYTPRQEDLQDDHDFHGLPEPLAAEDLALDVFNAGHELAGETPLLIVNEPMFISMGENSDIRYNFYYPRWAYDDYREMLSAYADQRGWLYLDLWDAVAPDEFTNSAIHLTPKGSSLLAQMIGDVITQSDLTSE